MQIARVGLFNLCSNSTLFTCKVLAGWVLYSHKVINKNIETDKRGLLVMKTHHISLLTGDAKLNADYYVGVLGMRFIKNSVNQANPKNRHVYYGDFMGTPGTVITFFPIDDLRDRTDGKMFFSGIHYSIPEGSTQYWLDRFAEKISSLE